MFNHVFSGGASVWKRLSLFFLIFIFLISCYRMGSRHESGKARLIENVPFFPQESFQCGPASLAGVLNYWGVKVSPEEITTEIYSPTARGTLNWDMILYAKKRGMKVFQYRGNLEDLKNKIDLGSPLIVLIDLGLLFYQQNHFMIVVGYDEEGIFAHSGKDRQTFIAFDRFIKAWKKTDYWTLFITSQ